MKLGRAGQAIKEGLHSIILTTRLSGEARAIGQFLGSIGQQLSETHDPLPKPACLIAGGETTVTIGGEGHGGRNLEVALSTVIKLASLKNIFMITLATDGDDGPTDAAVTWSMRQRNAR